LKSLNANQSNIMSQTILLYIKKPGLQTLVQDLGRQGFQAFGVPVNGAMDRTAAKVANWLVGNPPDTPLLEITLMGPTLSIIGDCQIALTGADLSAQIGQQILPRYETVNIEGSADISFGRIKEGCRPIWLLVESGRLKSGWVVAVRLRMQDSY
jgi:allophanate hydrolase subunit 2